MGIGNGVQGRTARKEAGMVALGGLEEKCRGISHGGSQEESQGNRRGIAGESQGNRRGIAGESQGNRRGIAGESQERSHGGRRGRGVEEGRRGRHC